MLFGDCADQSNSAATFCLKFGSMDRLDHPSHAGLPQTQWIFDRPRETGNCWSLRCTRWPCCRLRSHTRWSAGRPTTQSISRLTHFPTEHCRSFAAIRTARQSMVSPEIRFATHAGCVPLRVWMYQSPSRLRQHSASSIAIFDRLRIVHDASSQLTLRNRGALPDSSSCCPA